MTRTGGRYATSTQTPVDRTRAEIEKTLVRYGASRFAYGWDGDGAAVAFTLASRHIRFTLPLPDRADRRFTHTPTGRARTLDGVAVEHDQAVRSRWRALLLIVKAKLEAVDAGIVTLEDEFLAHTVLPDGSTIGQRIQPQIEAMYAADRQHMPALLAGPTPNP